MAIASQMIPWITPKTSPAAASQRGVRGGKELHKVQPDGLHVLVVLHEHAPALGLLLVLVHYLLAPGLLVLGPLRI